MPVFRPDDFIVEDSASPACGPSRLQWISAPGGLTQFGALIETLPPGSASSIKHWHAREDEMVLVLEGTVTLIEGETETLLAAGDAATFRAGDPVGHHLRNLGDAPVRYLVVGTRAPADVVTYPDHDRVLTRAEGRDDLWTDSGGRPAGNPYREA